jgi:diacylglycerol O-acyltransferase / wax synthase
MSIRSEADKGALGNRVSGMLVPIPTDLADPVERLHVVHDATVASKEAANAIPADVLTDMNEFMPFAFVGLASRTAARLRLADRSAPAVNTVVTNVPGPQQPLYLAGAQLLHQYGLGLVGDGTGLFHTVLSYNGELSISATACREMLPDPDFYAECLQSSFDELAEASGARDRAPKVRTARVR